MRSIPRCDMPNNGDCRVCSGNGRSCRYLSPPFERNALAASGLERLPPEWRRGDLVTLRSSGHRGKYTPPETDADRWPEVAIGQVRFRVRGSARPGSPSVSPQLGTIVRGDVLDSVSRRDPRRSTADVWTSGNRVFSCGSPDVLVVVLQAIADRTSPPARVAATLGRRLTPAEKCNIRAAMDHVSSIVRIESGELAAMGWAA